MSFNNNTFWGVLKFLWLESHLKALLYKALGLQVHFIVFSTFLSFKCGMLHNGWIEKCCCMWYTFSKQHFIMLDGGRAATMERSPLETCLQEIWYWPFFRKEPCQFSSQNFSHWSVQKNFVAVLNLSFKNNQLCFFLA